MNFFIAFIMGIIAGGLQIMMLSGFQGLFNPIMLGFISGVVAGDAGLGLQVGATCALMGMGFYFYGGSTTPDYNVGAIFGVFVAQQSGDIEQGIIVGSVIALLMSFFDIAGRTTTTVFQHGGDRALARRDIEAFKRWHFAGTIPWFLGRFIPVFIGMLFIGQYQIIDNIVTSLDWLKNGLTVVGRLLPAVGFGLLLSYMDIQRYWMFMLLGYVALAYAGVPTMGLAISGFAVAGIYIMYKKTFQGKEET